jgi:hypothetical protein
MVEAERIARLCNAPPTSRAGTSRSIGVSFESWMFSKGAEGSGSNERDMRAALSALQGTHGHTDRWSNRSVHTVERNEDVCQRSVALPTRLGMISWDMHTHRNAMGQKRPVLSPLGPGPGNFSETHRTTSPAKSLHRRSPSPAFTPIQEPHFPAMPGSAAAKFAPTR